MKLILKNVFDNTLFIILNFGRLIWRNCFVSSSFLNSVFASRVFLSIYRHRSGFQVSRGGASATHPDDSLCGSKWQSHVTVRTASSAVGSDLQSSASDSEIYLGIWSARHGSWSRMQRRLPWSSHVAATWVRMDGSVGWVALAFLLA